MIEWTFDQNWGFIDERNAALWRDQILFQKDKQKDKTKEEAQKKKKSGTTKKEDHSIAAVAVHEG